MTCVGLCDVNTKFVIRGLLLALPVAAVATVVGLMVGWAWIGPPPDPTPPPPTILAQRGEPPAGPGGLEEWVRYRGQACRLAGSGFLLRLSDGQVVGVTTAHSVAFGDPQRPPERIALRVAGEADFAVAFDTLRGRSGKPRTGDDLTVDYVLLQPDRPVDPDLVVEFDPRGAPQPGERVSLFSGLGDSQGGPRVLEGTVQSANDTAVWVLMDELFDPRLMSGSPFVSQHTGRVVGMAVAVSLRRSRLLLGVHPIGSLVRLGESATEFPRLSEYRP